MRDLLDDLRLALRGLRRTPWMGLAAVLSLALGIGANTTVFTFVRALLFPELPVVESRRLVSVYTRDEKVPYHLPNSYPNFEDYRRLNPVFEDMAAHLRIPLSLGRAEEAERVLGEIVSGSYFSVLGLRPLLGRFFTSEEDRVEGAHPVAVVSHALWTRRFAADPRLPGKTIALDGHPFTVIGVAPQGFRGTGVTAAVEVWVPMAMHREVLSTYSAWMDQRASVLVEAFGRLKPRLGLQEADAAMKTVARQLQQEYPAANKGRSVVLVPLEDARINPDARGAIVLTSGLLLVVVGLVLLIACANLANLLMARALSRRREIGVRLALGATRQQLVRGLLVESLALSAVGGVLGFLFAGWAAQHLWAQRPASLSQAFLDIAPSPGVLAFTTLLSLATGLGFGLAPAFQAARADVLAALKDLAGSGGPPRRFRSRNLLVVSQVCGSLVLLVTAVLFVRSMQEAHGIDPGFRVDDVLVMSLEPGLYGYDEAEGRAYYERVRDEARALPGVRSATFAQNPPLGGGSARKVALEGQPEEDRATYVPVNTVDRGYFETVGIPLLQGRDFDERDRREAPAVAIVNETMARKMFGEAAPLGRRFKLGSEPGFREVVGVARDSKYASLGENPKPFLYVPLAQSYAPGVYLHLRVSGEPSAFAGSLRGAVQAVDQTVRVAEARPLRQQLQASLWLPRLGASLLGFFGLLGLLLTVVGLYGVMAHAVGQRTQEIGVRMALGGRPGHVASLVLGEGMRLVAVGLGLGLLAAFGVTRLLSGLLYGVRATDPVLLGVTAVVLAAIAAVATYVPARAATRVDPALALRSE